MKRWLVMSLMFTFMAIYTGITDFFEAQSQQPIIIPIYHTGYYTIVASDYLTWTAIGAMCEIGFALLCFVRYWNQRGVILPG
jgi:uncharacterized membrane protein